MLSTALLHQTCHAACAPFTPNNSEQRSPPTYYRGCWHVVSRGLFLDSRHHEAIPCPTYSPSRKELYNLTAFFVHAASLHQTFVHCGRFLAAASRRSLGRVSELMGRGLIPRRSRRSFPAVHLCDQHLIWYYHMFPCAIPVRGADYPRVTHPSAALGLPKQAYRSTCMLKTRRQRSF